MLRLVLGIFFIALPVLELALLIKTGQAIGLWPTLGMVVGAGVLGAIIWSRQGMSVARKTRAALAQGKPPVGPALDGALLLLAGALLITPGFLTDILALLLLIPPIRHRLARWSIRRLVERARVHVKTAEASIEMNGKRDPAAANSGLGPVIEGEFERLGETASPPNRRKDAGNA